MSMILWPTIDGIDDIGDPELRHIEMPSQTVILPIALYIFILNILPFGIGFACRLLPRRSENPINPRWTTLGKCLVIFGWTTAFALGTTKTLSYPASILLCATGYVPGLFLLGLGSGWPRSA